MKTKSEILKEMTKAKCPESKYRMLRLEVEVDKRDEQFYTRGELESVTDTLKDIRKILLSLKEEQECDKEIK